MIKIEVLKYQRYFSVLFLPRQYYLSCLLLFVNRRTTVTNLSQNRSLEFLEPNFRISGRRDHRLLEGQVFLGIENTSPDIKIRIDPNCEEKRQCYLEVHC